MMLKKNMLETLELLFNNISRLDSLGSNSIFTQEHQTEGEV